MFQLNGSPAAALGFGSGSQMPFAKVVRRVTGLAKLGGKRGQVLSETQAVVPDACFRSVAAREQHGSRWGTDRLVGDRVIEIRSAAGQCVQVRCVRGTVQAVGADEVPTELIGMIDDDVRSLFQ